MQNFLCQCRIRPPPIATKIKAYTTRPFIQPLYLSLRLPVATRVCWGRDTPFKTGLKTGSHHSRLCLDPQLGIYKYLDFWRKTNYLRWEVFDLNYR